MADILKQIFIVPKCKRCFKLADKHNLCDKCAKELEKCRILNPQLPLNNKITLVDASYASYKYKGAAKDIIKSAKFRNPAAFLASFLDDISIDIKEILAQNSIDMVVPVPSHKSKLYTQEFDLPVEMARRIADYSGVEYSHCINKIRKTAKQHQLSKEERKVNLVNAFEVTENLRGKRILVIDDVITTGITVSTIATDLKIAGREKVYAWAYTLNIEGGNT